MSEILEDTEKIFKYIRKDKAQAELLVRKFEEDKAWEPYCKGRRDQFCLLYLIKIIEEYVPGEDNKEIVWLSFNLLDGFDDIKISKKRYNAYANKALETNSNEHVKEYWIRPYDSLQKIENKLIDRLVKVLENAAIKDKQGKMHLGFAEKIIKELPKNFPDGIPEKIPLPTPRCLKMQNSTEDEPTPMLLPDRTRTIKRLQLEVNIVIAMVIVLAMVIVVDRLHSARMAENEKGAAPLIMDILVTTPEIRLYPGKEGVIQLDIVPDGADVDSVNCIPDDPRVATVDHRIIKAQAEWQEENHETQITVQGGVSPHRQVYVTVLPDPREQFNGADRPDGRNEEKEGEQ